MKEIGSLLSMTRRNPMRRTLVALSALILFTVFPGDSWAMIELLAVFFAVVAVLIAAVSSVTAAVVKAVLLRYVIAPVNRPSLARLSAVALWEMITMSFALFLAGASLETFFVPDSPNKALLIAAFFGLAAAIQVLFGIFPNSRLIRPTPTEDPTGDNIVGRIGTAALLALITPVLVTLFVLGIGLSVAG